jgi:hypothetical protein
VDTHITQVDSHLTSAEANANGIPLGIQVASYGIDSSEQIVADQVLVEHIDDQWRLDIGGQTLIPKPGYNSGDWIFDLHGLSSDFLAQNLPQARLIPSAGFSGQEVTGFLSMAVSDTDAGGHQTWQRADIQVHAVITDAPAPAPQADEIAGDQPIEDGATLVVDPDGQGTAPAGDSEAASTDDVTAVAAPAPVDADSGATPAEAPAPADAAVSGADTTETATSDEASPDATTPADEGTATGQVTIDPLGQEEPPLNFDNLQAADSGSGTDQDLSALVNVQDMLDMPDSQDLAVLDALEQQPALAPEPVDAPSGDGGDGAGSAQPAAEADTYVPDQSVIDAQVPETHEDSNP